MAFFIFQYLKSLGDNFGQVSPSIYRSSQPDRDRLRKLYYNYKIKNIINLRDDLTSEEYDEVESMDMTLWNYPMSDSNAPTVSQVDSILFTIASHPKFSYLLVCCKGGRHRTGLILACYRVRYDNYSKEKAWKEALDYGFYSFGGHKPLEDFFFNTFVK